MWRSIESLLYIGARRSINGSPPSFIGTSWLPGDGTAALQPPLYALHEIVRRICLTGGHVYIRHDANAVDAPVNMKPAASIPHRFIIVLLPPVVLIPIISAS
jgi:hypothetical protein